MKKYFLILIILCAVFSVRGQNNSFSFQYSMGFGTGDLATFNSKTSFTGASISWQKYVKPQVSIGFEIGWNTFYNELGFETYTSGNASLTGKQYRYQNQFPMLVTANYYLKPSDAKVQPFVGLGMGTMFSRRNMDMNVYTFQQDAWHFAVRPEIGFLYHVTPETAAFVGVKYYTGFGAGDLPETQSYVTLNLGFVFIKN